MNINGHGNCLINTQLPPPYTSLVPDDDDIEGQTPEEYDDDDDGEDSALNSSTSVFDFEKSNIEPININNIEIIRTRSKQSKIRISFMILFKSCFCRGPMMMRILSALFFAISSFLLVVINKIILTTYHFPSVMIVGLGQVFATIIILNVCRRIGFIKFPYYSREINIKISPLPIFFFGNLVAGLGSTKRLNLPMLTVLRRFTILMTMIGEYYILGITQSTTIKMTVFMMIGGAIIAASNDLAFDMMGYICVLLNDIFSTFNGIYMKKKLDSRDLGKYGILYYNALFISIPLFVLSLCIDDYGECFLEFEHWNSPWFVLAFLMSNIMGFVLMYSTALCTQYNSALTTTIVGCLKNILVTFIGMYIGGDYIFSIVNFIGLNISMIGSLIYSYVIFVHKSTRTIKQSSSSSSSTSSTSSSDSSTPDSISKAKQSIVKE
ncbi:solute carrier family 35 member D2-like protein [Dermatophagoides pteronyssinus]|uniref:solute carrier family 35 member D2-like protein n=1 Tax=Dermatophagoides pteronyssinus TaxID=6956 RepID=UPI003F6633E8